MAWVSSRQSFNQVTTNEWSRTIFEKVVMSMRRTIKKNGKHLLSIFLRIRNKAPSCAPRFSTIQCTHTHIGGFCTCEHYIDPAYSTRPILNLSVRFSFASVISEASYIWMRESERAFRTFSFPCLAIRCIFTPIHWMNFNTHPLMLIVFKLLTFQPRSLDRSY